jgi:phosphoglucomutase
MAVSPLAGKPAPKELLVDVAKLERAFFERSPDMADPAQRVSFGTSGHRGSSLTGAFTRAHILAITQAICDYRKRQQTTGPLFLGKDTHALSGPAQDAALEVLAANGVETVFHGHGGFTPTPVISRAIVVHNHGRESALADGIVVTPSHNPTGRRRLQIQPAERRPADTAVTTWIQDRANALLRIGRRHPPRCARRGSRGAYHPRARPRAALCQRPRERDRDGHDPRRRP